MASYKELLERIDLLERCVGNLQNTRVHGPGVSYYRQATCDAPATMCLGQRVPEVCECWFPRIGDAGALVIDAIGGVAPIDGQWTTLTDDIVFPAGSLPVSDGKYWVYFDPSETGANPDDYFKITTMPDDSPSLDQVCIACFQVESGEVVAASLTRIWCQCKIIDPSGCIPPEELIDPDKIFLTGQRQEDLGSCESFYLVGPRCKGVVFDEEGRACPADVGATCKNIEAISGLVVSGLGDPITDGSTDNDVWQYTNETDCPQVITLCPTWALDIAISNSPLPGTLEEEQILSNCATWEWDITCLITVEIAPGVILPVAQEQKIVSSSSPMCWARTGTTFTLSLAEQTCVSAKKCFVLDPGFSTSLTIVYAFTGSSDVLTQGGGVRPSIFGSTEARLESLIAICQNSNEFAFV